MQGGIRIGVTIVGGEAGGGGEGGDTGGDTGVLLGTKEFRR